MHNGNYYPYDVIRQFTRSYTSRLLDAVINSTLFVVALQTNNVILRIVDDETLTFVNIIPILVLLLISISLTYLQDDGAPRTAAQIM